MAGNFFKRICKPSPDERFETISAVDKFITEKTGKKLQIRHVDSKLCTSRGSVFKVKKVGNPTSIFEKLLAS